MTAVFKPFQKVGLYLKQAGQKGRGVFTTDPIDQNEIIATTISISFGQDDADLIDKTHLYNYYFVSPENSHAFIGEIPLSILTMCNHSSAPNAIVTREETEIGIVFTLRALGNIAADTEIVHSYGEVWFDEV